VAVVVHFSLVTGVGVIVVTVISRVVMRMGKCISWVLMSVLVLVDVLVPMDMGMLVGVPLFPV